MNKSCFVFIIALLFNGLIHTSDASAGRGNTYTCIQEGGSVPEGHVLLVGKIAFDPPITQERLGRIPGGSPQRGEILFGVGDNADKPISKKKLFPFKHTTMVMMRLNNTSFVPIAPDTYFFRYANVIVDIQIKKTNTMRGMTHVDHTVIITTGDIRVDIPKGPKAVYVGTFVYKHDGENTILVSLEDEYKETVADSKKMNINGLSSGDVIKKLGKGIRPN